MSHGSSADDEIVAIIAALVGIVALIGGSIYWFFTTVALSIGDCTPQLQSGFLANGLKFAFGESPTPAVLEGMKITAGTGGLLGIAMVGAAYYWSQKQNTRRFARRSQRAKQLIMGLYGLGTLLTVVGLGISLSIGLGAEDACVGGFL